ncbi:MAG TPA: hypothetical protein VFM18_04035 [Methanosarcina sp.]|nr:hypothetical protein [Methanosarcina sp.]
MKKVQLTRENARVGDKVAMWGLEERNVNHDIPSYSKRNNVELIDTFYEISSFTSQDCIYMKKDDHIFGPFIINRFYKLEEVEVEEPVEEETNQPNKFEVLNWIYKGIPVQYKNPFANGQEWDRETGEWLYKKNTWVDLDVSANFSFFESFEYRIKPEEELKPETFYWTIFAKGKYSVTSKKYATEEDVKAAYKYPVEIISKLENR